MKTLTIPQQTFEEKTFPSYQITWQQMNSKLEDELNKQDASEFNELHEKVQTSAKKSLKQVEEFLRKHPKSPEVYNLLTFNYIKLKKLKKAEELIEKNYKNNPSSLFAKINYADQCLRKGSVEKIPFIFNHKFDLQELYPQRAVFHYSELVSFSTLMGFYYLKKEKKILAHDYYLFAKKIDPDDIAIKLLERKLSHCNLAKKLWKKVSRKI